MSTEQTTTETTDTEPQETPAEAQETPQGDEQPKGDREAAKLRKRAQAAETERDTLAERLAVLQRGEAERIATGAGLLADGADLWSATDLEALQDEHGNINAEAVTSAVADLLKVKPHYAHRRFQGSADGGSRQAVDIKGDPWAEAGAAIRKQRN